MSFIFFIFYNNFNLVSKKSFFCSIYVSNVFQTFQSCHFDRQHLNYKRKKLILRSNFDNSDIKILPIEIVYLQFSKERFRVWVLLGEILIEN